MKMKSFFLRMRDKLFLNVIRGTLSAEFETMRRSLYQSNAESVSKLSAKIDELHRRFDEEKYDIEVRAREIRVLTGNNITKFLSASIVNRETFLPFKNYCKGQKIVICGAGPSLQDYVPIKNAVHIALNRAFLYDKVLFDFIYVQDFDGIKRFQTDLESYRKNDCRKLFAWQYSREDWDWLEAKNTPESFVRKCDGKRFITDIFYQDDLNKCEFVPDIDSRAIGNFPNVALDCMQFALYMNPSKVYLVGLDHTGTHFSQKNLNEYEKTEENNYMEWYWKTVLEPTKKIWERCRQFAQTYYPDTEIISVNPVGLKGIFKDWYQNQGEEPK